MIAGAYEVAAPAKRPTARGRSPRSPRRWWSAVTTLLVAAVFSEAVFAGLMLSGIGWGRRAHALVAAVLIASTLAAGLVAVVTLRRVPHGGRLGVILSSLAAVMLLQTVVGRWAAGGANLMWIHVPLGVALVAFAARAAAGARRLGGEDEPRP